MSAPGRNWLVVAATMSFAASALHLACIVGGGDWYRFFGAGEELARLDEAGSWFPAILTFVIAVILASWGFYALAAAGLAAVLLSRATFVFFPATWGPELGFTFMAVTSAIVAVMGATFVIGAAKAWPSLRKVRA